MEISDKQPETLDDDTETQTVIVDSKIAQEKRDA